MSERAVGFDGEVSWGWEGVQGQGAVAVVGARVVDVDAVTALVHQVAAAVHLPLFGQGVAGEEKSPGEVVSRVDRDAERLLRDGLTRIAPDVPVLGEEAASADPSLLRLLQGEQPVWLVDPLDGTDAFLAGSPDHGMMLALVQAGRPLVGLVHQPQHGRTWTAERGSGAWRDGVRVHRRAPDAPGLPQLRGGVLRRFLDERARAAVEAGEHRFGDLTPRTTCAAVEYPRIVEGEADFLLFWRTLPWDHAPGALLLSEAGGVAVRPDRSAYRADDGRRGLLAAADAGTATAVLEGLGLLQGP